MFFQKLFRCLFQNSVGVVPAAVQASRNWAAKSLRTLQPKIIIWALSHLAFAFFFASDSIFNLFSGGAVIKCLFCPINNIALFVLVEQCKAVQSSRFNSVCSVSIFEPITHKRRTNQHFQSIYTTNKATIQSPFPALYRGFFLYRSGETRTRGLLLPKQARYQLRNTP